MKRPMRTWLGAPLLLLGCATAPPMPEPGPAHPAAAAAEPAPRLPVPDTLDLPHPDRTRTGEPR